jgi:hypothetical protein
MTPMEWLLGGDTGVSSKTILAVMTGNEVSGPFGADIPYDPSDFGRCYRLLQQFPEWKARLPEVAARYPIWGPMVEAWPQMETLWERESPTGKCPQLYAMMQELVDAGRLAAGWVRTSPHSWRGPAKQNKEVTCK